MILIVNTVRISVCVYQSSEKVLYAMFFYVFLKCINNSLINYVQQTNKSKKCVCI